jgi:hypothetical protein
MDILTLLWYANIVGELLVFTKLFWLGITKRYKWFALYLAASTLRDIALIIVNKTTSKPYWTLWTSTEALVLILLTAAVLEVFAQIVNSFPDMGTFRRNTLNICLGIGGVVTVILAFIEAKGYGSFWFVLKRGVTSILAVFLGCIGWLFLWVRVPRNTVRHCWILAIFCSVIALSYFSVHLGLKPRAANLIVLTGCLVCFVLWLLFLSPKGEALRVRLSSPDEREGYLKRFNDLTRWYLSLAWLGVRLLRSCMFQRKEPDSTP